MLSNIIDGTDLTDEQIHNMTWSHKCRLISSDQSHVKMRERKTRDWKTLHYTARVENAGLENVWTTKYGKLNVK